MINPKGLKVPAKTESSTLLSEIKQNMTKQNSWRKKYTRNYND